MKNLCWVRRDLKLHDHAALSNALKSGETTVVFVFDSPSSDCDAQPYFRIFNPYTQSEKFDSDGTFIREWIPELARASKKKFHRPDSLLFKNYPAPIVSYETNRIRCLALYAAVIPKAK